TWGPTYTPDGSAAAITTIWYRDSDAHTVGSTVIATRSFNSGLQPVLLSATVNSQPIVSFCYDFHLGKSISSPPCVFSAYTSGDNGNAFQVLDNVDSTRSRTFRYDSLNRISQANTITT